MKKINGVWHIPTNISMSPFDLEGPVEDAIAFLQDLATNLVEPTLEAEFGGESFNLKGFRPATEAEIKRHGRKLAKDRERAKQIREAKAAEAEAEKLRALEVARREFPDLFKCELPPAMEIAE